MSRDEEIRSIVDMLEEMEPDISTERLLATATAILQTLDELRERVETLEDAQRKSLAGRLLPWRRRIKWTGSAREPRR